MSYALKNIKFEVGQVWKVNWEDAKVTGVTKDAIDFSNGINLRTADWYPSLSLFMVKGSELLGNDDISE